MKPTATLISVAVLIAGVFCSGLSTHAADLDEGLVHRWQLNQEHVAEGAAKPLAGKLALRNADSVRFAVESPEAAVFGDRGSTQLFLEAESTDPTKLSLPKNQFTAEAWVRVDKPLEWGGVFGIIEDNGNYERGWLLGYRKSRFFFALSTEKPKRLTYLHSPVDFEVGSWYHIAGVWDGTVQSLYVDGELIATSKAQGGPVAYPDEMKSAHFGIGAYWDKSEYHALTGQVEQVSLWSRPLTRGELAKRFEDRKSKFPGIEAAHPVVADWPTHRRDNQRTGIAPDVTVSLPLHTRWVHQAGKRPSPAWPPPAHHDFWNRKRDLKPRVTFDRACPLIAVGDTVFYSSSSEDQVVCLDADTGAVRWQAFAEAPVRLAPTYDHGRVLFGSDDGSVYCVSAEDGSLLWRRRLVEEDRQIVGNGRMMSVWPVRSGVLVDDSKAFFCAGLFPGQGIYQAAVDVATGKLLGQARINVAAQGYLERKGSRLHTATGRDPAGAFVSTLSRRGKGVGKEVRSIPARYPYAFIGDAKSRFAGGCNEVAAFDGSTGEEAWQAEVDGRVWTLAISQSRLFVSTDEGAIYCFGKEPEKVLETRAPGSLPKALTMSPEQLQATLLMEKTKRKLSGSKGWALVINPGTGELATAIAGATKFQIVCLEPNEEAATVARKRFDRAGLAGRISVHTARRKEKLPYSDYLFNLVVDAAAVVKSERGLRFDRSEIERVTRPDGGLAMLGPEEDDLFRRGPLADIGEWTHQYADPGNTVCSGDRRVRGEMKLQWFGAPGPRGMMDRHHRTAAPLWADGRIIIPGDNRIVVADAYNGTPLWAAEIPNSRRAGVYRDASQLAASGDSVYVSTAAECLHLNAADGGERKRFLLPGEESPSLTNFEWGYLATVDDILFGTKQMKGSTRREHSREQIEEGTYFDSRPLVCSDSLFALQRETGEHFWQYETKSGPIVNSTIAIADGHAVFLESTQAELAKSKTGRHKAVDLFRSPPLLTVLDMRTGSRLWQKPLDLKRIQHTIYVSAVRNRILVHGSFNRAAAGKAKVHLDVSVFDADSGKQLWQKVQNTGAQVGGAHGEQDLHPVIVGKRLYCEPFAFDLETGKPLDDWKWTYGRRRGCGTISAAASTFFFRHSHPTMFDLTGNSYSKVTTSTRPGCWINMIPAGGLLLIPEASSGCSCNYAIQSSMAFLPVPSP